MVDNELVDKITKEILRTLNAQGGSAATSKGAPAAGAAGAAGVAAGSTASREAHAEGAGSGGSFAAPGAARGIGAGPLARGRGTREDAAGGGRSAKLLTPADIASYIDHTLLKPEATVEQIDKLCDEAIRYSFYSVCVNSGWVAHCAKRLAGSGVKIAAVVGFPLGAMAGRSKNAEARHAIDEGAREIDMVMNIGAMKSGNYKLVENDILWVVRACAGNVICKVIIETALLTDEEKVLACQIAKNAGADFVKTSTGFSTQGATVKDVALMRRTVGPNLGVKAAGGVRNFEDAIAMIEAGATRIGTSAGVKIVTGGSSGGGY